MNNKKTETLLLAILEEIESKIHEKYKFHGSNSYDYRCGMHDAGQILNKYTNVYKNELDALKKLKPENLKIITFSKENEAKRQSGISPDSILYCGEIDKITNEELKEISLTYIDFFKKLRYAQEDEPFCLIYS